MLLIDIVGYSKLLITEQSELIQKLKEIVRGTEQVRMAEVEGKLLRLRGAYLFVIKGDPFLDGSSRRSALRSARAEDRGAKKVAAFAGSCCSNGALSPLHGC